MYKSVPSDLKKINLDADLYKLHKSGKGNSDFGMDNTSDLLDEGFGLYSTIDLKKNIGPIKTQYFRDTSISAITRFRQAKVFIHVFLN